MCPGCKVNGDCFNNVNGGSRCPGLGPKEEKPAKGERRNVLEVIASLKLPHYYCEDSWYSCPENPEGCSDGRETKCNCGANEHNAKVDAIIKELKQYGWE